MAKKPTRPKLDEIATRDQQDAWLKSSLNLDATPLRAMPTLADDPYDDRLQRLVRSQEWPEFAACLRGYIQNAIFEPFKTQPSKTQPGWWNVTLAKGAASAHDNVWRQYVFEIDFRLDPTDQVVKARGTFWVDKAEAEKAMASGDPLDTCFEFRETSLKGHSRPQIAIRIEGASLSQLAELFNTDWMLAATRTLNIDLMRGGELAFDWRQYHMPKLIDAIFAEDFSHDRPAGEHTSEAPDSEPISLTDPDPISLGTEYQRLVWLRKNEAKFSDPVRSFWRNRSAITGIEAPNLLEPCHIKPFNEAEENERLNPFNGLCPAAHMHAAFDAELIGFSPPGEVHFSKRLSLDDRRRMTLADGVRVQVTEQHRPYLEYRYAQFLEANKR